MRSRTNARRVVRPWLWTVLAAAMLAIPVAGFAQQVTPEQLRMLQQLPASERQALMRSLGISPQDVPSAGSQGVSTGGNGATGMPPVPTTDFAAEEETPRLGPEDSIVLTLNVQPKLLEEDPDEVERILASDQWLAALRGNNAFRLDADGVLNLPGVASIPLAGLTVEEAARRIAAEDSLSIFEPTVTYLPLEETGSGALEPYGYLVFKGRSAAAFEPPMDVPVPQDYVLGPGDTINVQLFGNVNATYVLPVNRDGTINFPDIGPIPVAGLEFGQMKDVVESRIREQMIGVRTSITVGELRSMQVFILGDVTRPGSYTVSSLATVFNALFASGGVALEGSLRNVQVRRNGALVTRVDGYDVLLRGDTSGDIRLQPGDVIFVPPVGPQVGVSGQVKRPAIYEIAGETTVGQAIDLAGGVLSTAFEGQATVERIGENGDRRVLTLDLRDSADRLTVVRDGDVIRVESVLDRLEEGIRLSGHVFRPGVYEWKPGMRLTDLLPSPDLLRPQADRNYVLIRREAEPSGPITVLSADYSAAVRAPRTEQDPLLAERDEIIVFDLAKGRERRISPILEELQLQAVFGEPTREVIVSGQARVPGTYPLEDGMRVSDLIRAGGGLTEAAYGASAELTRYQIGADRRRATELVQVDLDAVLSGDETADILLRPFDVLNIKETPLWREHWSVEIKGEVNFPGRYAITPGESLRSVVERAGGLTEFAFPQGAVFLREELKEREREQLARLANRIESDLATLSFQAARFEDANLGQSMGLGQSLLSQLRDARPTGRLVIDLPALLAAGSDEPGLVLKDKDTLIVPELTQEVTVIGEVQYSTSHLFESGLTRGDYIELSGGLTANADKKRIYVVKANGSVQTGQSDSMWFRSQARGRMQPGDTIVVPLNVDRMPSLALWQTSTTIIYNLAIAAAAIGSL